MNRKVTYARLQTGAFVGGVDLGNVFPGTKTLKDLEMSVSENWLNLKFEHNGKKSDLLIPSGNVVILQLAPEVKNSK